MESSGKIEAKKTHIGELFEKFWFEIPNYQRHYVWEVDNVRKLLDDIYSHYKERCSQKVENQEEYFLGSLVLQKKQEKDSYDVLDGQQRLTTLLLILSVIRDITENVNDRDKYIKAAANPDKLINEDRNRINFKIRDNVEDFCKKYVFDYKSGINPDEKYNEISQYVKGNNISLKNMSNALIEIKNFFINMEKSEINNFFQMFLNNVILIYISTENKEDAFRLFTILNSRGVPLSNADILKSINLGAIKDKYEQEKYSKKWEDIEESFEKDEFDRFLSHIRAILVQQKARGTLLNEFEKIIYNTDKPILKKGKETIDLIEKYYNIYSKIILLEPTSDNDSKGTLDNKYRNLINILNAAFSSTDWIPPLIKYYEKFKNVRITEFLKKMEEKALCDIICRESTTIRMDSFHKIISLINDSNTPEDILDVKNNALENYNKDNAVNIIKNEGIYGRTFDKYILLKYEYLNLDNTVVVSDYSNLSIEHVLPQKPNNDSQWVQDFTEEQREIWTHNIANLIIINGRKNSALSNLDFSNKKIKLQEKIKDIFKGSSEVLNEKYWNENTLEKRLSNMIDVLFK